LLHKRQRLIVTGSCHSSHHRRFMREKFFKNEISVSLIYFKFKSTSWKTDLHDFVDGFDSRHDNRRITSHDI